MSGLDYIKDWRILIVIIAIAILAVLDVVHGLNPGIEFVGGTQIPITLAHSVNPLEMSSITQILDQRISKFGLSQVTVEPVGDSGLYVEIPTTTGAEINNTITVIKSQGIFQGIVGGKEAINGTGILSGGITTHDADPVRRECNLAGRLLRNYAAQRPSSQRPHSGRQTSRYTCFLTGPQMQ